MPGDDPKQAHHHCQGHRTRPSTSTLSSTDEANCKSTDSISNPSLLHRKRKLFSIGNHATAQPQAQAHHNLRLWQQARARMRSDVSQYVSQLASRSRPSQLATPTGAQTYSQASSCFTRFAVTIQRVHIIAGVNVGSPRRRDTKCQGWMSGGQFILK